MKKLILIVLLFYLTNILSQNKSEQISINFKNLNKKEIIELIEEKTDYHFFYIDKWLGEKKTSDSFINASITEVLNSIFNNTSINYYILNKKEIILTYGNLIKKSLYETSPKDNNNPIVLINTKDYKNIIKVGKEDDLKKDKYLISGIIKNNKTGTPIEGVSIFERKKNIYTSTNNKGYFSLTLPYGQNKIETSFVGFNNLTKNLIIYGDGSLNLFINEESEQLDEIIIDASKNKNTRQTVSGVTQIKTQQIKNIPLVLGERDILKVATSLPGIKTAGEGSEGVNVRGGKVDQNLFLLDDGTIYNPTHFLGLFSAINPFVTKDLKIYKGNTPVEYGGRLSSVFDIRTKNPNTKKFQGEASIGPVTGNINLEFPIVKEKSGILIGIRSTYSDWLLNLLDDKKLRNSNVSFFDGITKYNHKLNDNNSIKITTYHSKDQYKIASDTINKYSNTVASVNWHHRFNNKNSGNLIMSNSNYTFNIDYKSDNTNKGFDLKYRINETGLKIKMKYAHSEKHNIDYGLESKFYNVSPGSIKPNGDLSTVKPLSINNEKGIETGLFISDEIPVNKNLTVNLGLRFSQYLLLGFDHRVYQENSPKNSSTLVNTIYNKSYKTYQGLSYRFSSRYLLNQNLSLKASFNKSFQYIHRLNNNTTATPIDTWRLSDPNIKPQEALQATLGVFKNLKENEYEISLEGYYKKYKNLLDYKVGANLLLNENIETEVLQGDGKSYGAELLIKKNKGKLNGWIGYSYSRSLIRLNSLFNEETVNNGLFFPTNYDKPHDFSAILNYKFTKRYSFSTNFTYQTGRPITYPTGKYNYQGVEYLTYSNRNQFRIPDYYRLDIGFNIEGNHKIKKFAHSFWNISIYNVLGRNNPYSVYFQTVNGNVNGYKSSIFSTPIPTITYNFKF